MRHVLHDKVHLVGTIRVLVAALFALSLVGCGNLPNGAQLPDEQPVGELPGDEELELDKPLTADIDTPQYVMTVVLQSSDTIESIEEKYGGEVVVWEPGDYALVGVDAVPDDTDVVVDVNDPNTFTAGGEMATAEGTEAFFAEGASTLWAEGASTLWAEGASTLWAEGASTLWAEGTGTFQIMPHNTSSWNDINLRDAHAIASNLGRGVKVAIIDTGVDLQHPAFVNSLAPKSEWWDFYDNDAVPDEVKPTEGLGAFSHGSNVAGIVLQVAPAATILPIRVLGPAGQGDVVSVAAAIDWAVRQGADVVNLSLGADKPVHTVAKALRRAADDGVFVISSTGNGSQSNWISYPAAAADKRSQTQRQHLVSVTSFDGQADVVDDGFTPTATAEDISGNTSTFWLSDFANYSKDVELAAPGRNIYGPFPDDPTLWSIWTGTSMSAPVAAGALALALGETFSSEKATLADRLNEFSGEYDAPHPSGQEEKRQSVSGRIDLQLYLCNIMSCGDGD